MSVAQSNRLQPRSGDYIPHDGHGPPRSPPYRQPPTRYTDSPYGQYPEQAYRGPPSDIVDRREYRDLPEFGRNGYRGHAGSLPRDSSLPYHPAGNRPSSALPDQFHPPHHPYMTSPRAPASHQQQQPQYSNGSYNGPAVMESPPRPGMNRDTEDSKDRLYQQTVSANQQYERVSPVFFHKLFSGKDKCSPILHTSVGPVSRLV